MLAEQENMPPRVADALPALAAPLTRGIENFTRSQAGNLIASSEFEDGLGGREPGRPLAGRRAARG